jgi:hypothetical protein
MLKFNTLLQEAGFDPKKVFLLRHEDQRVPSGLYQVWKSARKDFEGYQSNQQWKNRFAEGSSLAAFVVGPEGEILFVGMYDVLRLSRLNEPFVDPLLGKRPAGDHALHEIKHSDRMQDYEEKVVIEWTERAWRQRAHQQNKVILEIRARPKEEPFPQSVNLLRRLEGDQTRSAIRSRTGLVGRRLYAPRRVHDWRSTPGDRRRLIEFGFGKGR